MEKKLRDLTITEFIEVLASNQPAPGGGSAAALCGAQGAGLVAMVCDLTLGKEKFQEFFARCEEVKAIMSPLKDDFLLLIDKDTEAFNIVSAAFKMPKTTDEEKKARSSAIQEGTIKSTEVPFEVMTKAHKAILSLVDFADKTNSNCASDLGVGLNNLVTCIKGAWYNVLINISGIKDENIREDYRAKGQKLLDEALMAAGKIEEDVLKLL